MDHLQGVEFDVFLNGLLVRLASGRLDRVGVLGCLSLGVLQAGSAPIRS
jgi:hypothetical protein